MEKSATPHLVNVTPRCFKDAVALWDAELVVAEVLVAGTPLVLSGAVGEVVEPVPCIAAQNNITSKKIQMMNCSNNFKMGFFQLTQ